MRKVYNFRMKSISFTFIYGLWSLYKVFLKWFLYLKGIPIIKINFQRSHFSNYYYMIKSWDKGMNHVTLDLQVINMMN